MHRKFDSFFLFSALIALILPRLTFPISVTFQLGKKVSIDIIHLSHFVSTDGLNCTNFNEYNSNVTCCEVSTSKWKCLPYFIIAGTQKSGTTALSGNTC